MPHAMIVLPARKNDDGPARTQGTRVFVGQEELEGVYKIEITADVNDVWRAVIHVHPSMFDMENLKAEVHYRYWTSFWAMLKWKFNGWRRARYDN